MEYIILANLACVPLNSYVVGSTKRLNFRLINLAAVVLNLGMVAEYIITSM